MTRRGRLAMTLGLVLTSLAQVPSAGAQDVDVPVLEVDRAEVNPQGVVVVTFSGWRTRNVTLSVCGNGAVRGSSDCNTTASEGIGLRRDAELSRRDFYVYPPPVPCPCVLRAASPTNDEVATTPIAITGHPIAPIVYPEGFEALEIDVRAVQATSGAVDWLRSALGGPTDFDVTISVRNRSPEPVSSITISGAVTRHGRDIATLSLPTIGEIAAEDGWQSTVRTEVPAPSLGEVVWEVHGSGARASVSSTTSTRLVPWLLFVLVVVLAGDLGLIAGRRLVARQRRRVQLGHRLASVDKEATAPA